MAEKWKKTIPHIFQSVFLKMFLCLVCVTILPILFIAAVFYNQSLQFWKSESYQNGVSELRSIVVQVDDRISAIDREMDVIANNPLVVNFILTPSFDQVSRNYALSKLLIDSKTTYGEGDSVYLYSDFADLLLTSDGKGYPSDAFYDRSGLGLYKAGAWKNDCPTVREIAQPGGGAARYVSLVKNVPERSIGHLGGLVWNINIKRLFSGIPDRELPLRVYDADGGLIFSSGAKLTDDPGLLQRVKEHQGEPFVYRQNRGGVDKVVFSGRSQSTGWSYVCAAPLQSFYQGARAISTKILVLSAIMLVVCLAVAYLAAGRMYGPLKKLTAAIAPQGRSPDGSLDEYGMIGTAFEDVRTQNSDLNKMLDAIRPGVRNDFFLELLLGTPFSKADIGQKLQFIGEGFTERGYFLVLIHISGGRAREELDRNLPIAQIMVEINRLLPRSPHALIQTDLQEWVILVNAGESEKARVSDPIETVIREKNLPAMALIGDVKETISEIHPAFQEIEEYLRYKLYQEELDSRVDSLRPETPYCNMELENGLIQALAERDTLRLEETLQKYLSALERSAKKPDDLYYACVHLVDIGIEAMVSRSERIDLSEFQCVYQELSGEREKDRLYESVTRFYSAMTRTYENSQDRHREKAVERMRDYIDLHLKDGITLNELAAHVGLSSAYVSRIFKETLGVGFLEFLNTSRIDRAKILLSETKMNVEQVGFEVGFNNLRSFMRTFKQYTGTSPGKYREGAEGGTG